MRTLIKRLGSISLPAGLVLLLALPGIAQGSAQKKPDSLRAVRLDKVATFRAVYPEVQIQTNPVTGVPEDLWGDLSKNQTQSEPVEAAYEFFEQNKELYGISNPREQLKLQRKAIDQYGGMVDFKQLYKGVEIHRSSLRAYFTPSGKLKGIMGGFAQVENLSAIPSIDSNSAIKIAKRELKLPEAYRSKNMEWAKKSDPGGSAALRIISRKGEYGLVWIVGVYVDNPQGSWEYIIDANSGEILSKKDTIKKEPRVPLPNTAPLPKGIFEDSASRPKPEPQSTPLLEQEVPVLPARPLGPADTLKAHPEGLPAARPRLNISDSFPSEKGLKVVRDSLGLFHFGPVQRRLERPMDSIIKDLEQRPEEPERPKKNIDSAKSNLSAISATFTDIVRQGFEDPFPGFRKNWYAFDIDDITNGEYFWDDWYFMPHTGGWNAWCARGGVNGLDPQFNNYPNNMQSWMVYGPFSLTDAFDAELNFYFWLKSEANAPQNKSDRLWWGVSTDGVNFYTPEGRAGNSNGWLPGRLPLDSINLGGGVYQNLIGLTGLYIVFIFESDGSVTDKGAFLDDIVLKKDASFGTPDLACYQPPFWDGPIVVSNQRGTNTHSQIYASRPAYIDWAYKNIGTRATSTRIWTNLIIDGTIRASYYTDPPFNTFDPPLGVVDFAWTFTTPGTHRVSLRHDYYNTETESDEFNDTCFYEFNVLPCPPGDGIGTGNGVLGYSQNHIDINCTGNYYQLLDLTREANNNPHFHNGQMQNNAAIWTLRWHPSGIPQVISDPDTFWNDPPIASGVDAQVYAGLTYDYLLYPLGRNGFDGVGDGMVSFVDNASMTGIGARFDSTFKRVEYATSGGGYRSYAGAIEFVAHEWGHGVTFLTSHLADSLEPGALDESFSDMLGVSVDFAKGLFPDWQTGEDISLSGRPISDLSNPPNPNSWPYRQPDTYRGPFWVFRSACNTDTCQVRLTHTNRGVSNKMFHLFANGGFHNEISVTGIGSIDNAMKVMLRAQEQRYWDDTTTFLRARAGSIRAANDLDFSGQWATQLKKAWDAVRVCERGDIDGNGSLTPADFALEIICVYAGRGCNPCASDLNCDGLFKPSDVAFELMRVYAGRPDNACPAP